MKGFETRYAGRLSSRPCEDWREIRSPIEAKERTALKSVAFWMCFRRS